MERPAALPRLGSIPGWQSARWRHLRCWPWGAIHLHEYNKLHSAIPTIGTLFVLNFAGAAAIGLGLLAPVERLFGGRLVAAAVGLLALGGIGLAATAFAFLTISEHTPLGAPTPS